MANWPRILSHGKQFVSLPINFAEECATICIWMGESFVIRPEEMRWTETRKNVPQQCEFSEYEEFASDYKLHNLLFVFPWRLHRRRDPMQRNAGPGKLIPVQLRKISPSPNDDIKKLVSIYQIRSRSTSTSLNLATTKERRRKDAWIGRQTSIHQEEMVQFQ